MNVAVVPMDTERVLAGQTVVVEGGWITALGPSKKIRVPAGAVRIDGRGKFLIPGLADMHAHMELASKFGRRESDLSQSDRLLLKEQQLFLWLAHGLTTVRNMDHAPSLVGSDRSGEEVLQLRARAAAGTILSPRIYTAGYIAGRLSRDVDQLLQDRPLELEDVAEAVRTYKVAGFDFIKVHPYIMASTAVFDSVAAAARRVDLPLEGHAMVSLEHAFATQRSIEHLSGYVEWAMGAPPALGTPKSHDELVGLAPRIQELAAATQRSGIWNCPTLYLAITNHVPPLVLELGQQVIQALQKAGANLLLGSDRLGTRRNPADLIEEKESLTPEQERLEITYGYAASTHRELQALVLKAGLTPYQALATGTRNVAAFFGTLDSTGTVAVGKRADLVLLEGNPLADIRQTERIAGVMLGGRWLDRGELDRRTAEISAWLGRWCKCAAGVQVP